jgi:translation initiation factor IF-2
LFAQRLLKVMENKNAKSKNTSAVAHRAPVVVVLGHIDHGKTTLLDYIRRSKVATKEAGGITQSIGAYQIELGVKVPGDSGAGKNRKSHQAPQHPSTSPTRKITFIDTPGHEAFAKMRARGAKVADVAVLVVAANDGVMPQTKEAIAHAKTAGVPIVVALNKIDLPDVNIAKIEGQLVKEGVVPESQGGDVPLVKVSAKSGEGVPELLEMISLVADMLELIDRPSAPLRAVVVESRRSARQGPVATVVVKEGPLHVGDAIEAGGVGGKVRALLDYSGKRVKEARPGMPVEILGFSNVAPVGAEVGEPAGGARPEKTPGLPTAHSVDSLNVVLRADTQGSLEAVVAAVSKIEDGGVNILFSGVGQVVDSDIYLAQSAGQHAVVLGFNVGVSASAKKLAEDLGVGVRSFAIIYDLLETIEKLVQGVAALEKAQIKGEGEVIKLFILHSGDKVLGVRVTTGKLRYRDKITLFRGEDEVHRGRIRGLKVGTGEVAVASEGQEAGVLLKPQFDDPKVGDRVVVE